MSLTPFKLRQAAAFLEQPPPPVNPPPNDSLTGLLRGAAAEIERLHSLLKECADRFERCCRTAGNDAQTAADAVEKYRFARALPDKRTEDKMMGIPEQRRSVRGMLKRWKRDETRLEALFGGPVTTDDSTHSGEMLRNLGTAISYAQAFLASSPSEAAPASAGKRE